MKNPVEGRAAEIARREAEQEAVAPEESSIPTLPEGAFQAPTTPHHQRVGKELYAKYQGRGVIFL